MRNVTVLSFNIALGGDIVDIAGVAEAIRQSGAAVAGLQECGANAERIASLLGWAHIDERSQIVSSLPLLPSTEPGTVLVQIAPGEVFVLGNVHLPSDPYGPYELRDGMSPSDTVALEERLRLAAFDRHVPLWRKWLDTGAPVVVTGDFNAPSHRDWGSGANDHRVAEVAWPVSLAAERLGLVDTYRAANPDRPGITWTHGFPYPRVDPNELRDRIDFVWAGNATVVASRMLGPAGAPDIDISVDPWPSDHLGVVTELELVPAPPPPMVAPTKIRYERGERITVRFCADRSDRIVLGRDGIEMHWLPPMEADRFGSVGFGTTILDPGEYDISLVTEAGVIDQRKVWVFDPGTRPSVSAAISDAGLTVSWEAAPARAFDWIGVYCAGDPDLYHGSIERTYTGATVTGSHHFPELAPGAYTVRLMSNDSCVVLAEAHAEI